MTEISFERPGGLEKADTVYWSEADKDTATVYPLWCSGNMRDFDRQALGALVGAALQESFLGGFVVVVRDYLANDRHGDFELFAMRALPHYTCQTNDSKCHRGDIEKIRAFCQGFLAGRRKAEK